MWLGSTWSNQDPFGTNPKINQYAIEMDVWNVCGLDKSNRTWRIQLNVKKFKLKLVWE